MPLTDVFDLVADRSKTLRCFHTGQIDALRHFDSEPDSLKLHTLPDAGSDGFVLCYEDDEFVSAIPIESFAVLEDPPLDPPWTARDAREPLTGLLELLEDMPFVEFDRRQMLATSRVIEERAWRYGYGTLHAGFQSIEALERQQPIYTELTTRSELSIELYVSDGFDGDVPPGTVVHEVPAALLEASWFVVYDAGGDVINTCGLLAAEREPNSFHGFWTTEPDYVDAILSHLGRESD